MSHPLALLQTRHSAPSRQLGEPGPDTATLKTLLEAAIRVPDHGKLEPFRLIVLQGEAKQVFGERLATLSLRVNPDMTESKREKDRTRYDFYPGTSTVSNMIAPRILNHSGRRQLPPAGGCPFARFVSGNRPSLPIRPA